MVVPYSNTTDVEPPLGFTVPFKVADVEVIDVADPVVAVGLAMFVEKLRSLPEVVPTLFVDLTRK